MSTDKKQFFLHRCASVFIGGLILSGFAVHAQTHPTTEPRGGRIVTPEKVEVPGKRFAMAQGELFIPDFFKAGEKTDVVLWFQGAAWVVEQEFYAAHKNAVL